MTVLYGFSNDGLLFLIAVRIQGATPWFDVLCQEFPGASQRESQRLDSCRCLLYPPLPVLPVLCSVGCHERPLRTDLCYLLRVLLYVPHNERDRPPLPLTQRADALHLLVHRLPRDEYLRLRWLACSLLLLGASLVHALRQLVLHPPAAGAKLRRVLLL